jgi:hypothetical protein
VVTPDFDVGGGRFTPLDVAWCPREVCATCLSTATWLLSVQGVFWDLNGVNRGRWGGVSNENR